MHIDSFSVSSISKKPAFPLRTWILPLNATLMTTDPVAQSSGAFIPKDPSFTRSSSLLTILLSTSVPSYATSHTISSSLIPSVSMTSSLTQNINCYSNISFISRYRRNLKKSTLCNFFCRFFYINKPFYQPFSSTRNIHCNALFTND